MDAQVKSAERVIRILDALSAHPPGLSFTELLTLTEIPKSSLHALLYTLSESKVVELDPKTRQYAPGPKLWELAMAYVRHLELVPLAWPWLEELRDRFDETVQMGVLEGGDVVYLAKAPSSHPLQLVSHVGSRLPAYATGIGKALLAGLGPAALRRLFPSETLKTYTPRTIGERELLLRELEDIRRRGYARDLGEYSLDVRCLAAPVVDFNGTVVAAISLTMASERFSAAREQEMVPVLLETVKRISERLGGVDWDMWRRRGAPHPESGATETMVQ
jgi:DNA-binding IclR family transcriptional regulator